MAHAAEPTEKNELFRSGTPPVYVTPGKVAIWLFLATEVMFFTGLIGSYIVLRAGSPPTALSNQFPPATDEKTLPPAPTAVVLEDPGQNKSEVLRIIQSETSYKEEL